MAVFSLGLGFRGMCSLAGGTFDDLGKSEVGDFDMPLAIDQDVLWLQVCHITG